MTEFTWNLGDNLVMTVPAGADVNGDGAIEFAVTLDVETTFTNITGVTRELQKTWEAGRLTAIVQTVTQPEISSRSLSRSARYWTRLLSA